MFHYIGTSKCYSIRSAFTNHDYYFLSVASLCRSIGAALVLHSQLATHSDLEHGINVKTKNLSNAKTVRLILKRTL